MRLANRAESSHDPITLSASESRFSLLGWFSILSLITIAVIGISMMSFMTIFLKNKLLMQDAILSRDFIEGIVATENTRTYLQRREPNHSQALLDAFTAHVPTFPDVVRANLFGVDRFVIWSSNPKLVGMRFADNRELEIALTGQIVVETGETAVAGGKPEHIGLASAAGPHGRQRFVEAYIPIRDESGKAVLAVIEIYKLPNALFETIDSGLRLVWLAAAGGGILLYVTLFGIVWKAHTIMREQRERLIAAERLAVIGEMAATVAHAIRNPLASIRSTAEIGLEDDRAGTEASFNKIMRQIDRVDAWIRELLIGSIGSDEVREDVDIEAVIRECLDSLKVETDLQNIEVSFEPRQTPPLRGARVQLTRAITNVLTNAVQAMPKGGRLVVESHATRGGNLEIVIGDSGHGMGPSLARRVFEPFMTTKPNGTGLGLALARRIIERHAGRIRLETSEGHGTRIILNLPQSP